MHIYFSFPFLHFVRFGRKKTKFWDTKFSRKKKKQNRTQVRRNNSKRKWRQTKNDRIIVNKCFIKYHTLALVIVQINEDFINWWGLFSSFFTKYNKQSEKDKKTKKNQSKTIQIDKMFLDIFFLDGMAPLSIEYYWSENDRIYRIQNTDNKLIFNNFHLDFL